MIGSHPISSIRKERLSSHKPPTNDIIIEGHLVSKTYSRVNNIPILIKQDNKIIATDTSDEYGDFTTSFNEHNINNHPLYLLYTNDQRDTLIIKKYTKFKDQITKETFVIP